MTSQIYECSKCPKIDTQRKLTEHFIRTHVTIEEAPWRCSLCNFKALSRHQLLNHTNHFRHQQAVKRCPGVMFEYIESKTPYKVQFGRDIWPHREDEPMYNIGVDKVIDYHHKSFGIVLSTGLDFDYSVGETESEEDEERRNRFCEREGNTWERRNRSREEDGNGGERKKKSEEREGNTMERRRKSDEREGNGGERRRKSGEMAGKEEGNLRKEREMAEKEERNLRKERETVGKEEENLRKEKEMAGKEENLRKERGMAGKEEINLRKERETVGKEEENLRKEKEMAGKEEKEKRERNGVGKERGNKRQRTSESDSKNKKPKLISSSDEGSRIKTKGTRTTRRERVPMATNDAGVNEETNMKDLLEDKNVTGITKTYKEAKRAKTSFSLKTEELDLPLNNNLQPNKQIYDHSKEPTPDVEESAEVKVELGIADQPSQAGTESEPDVEVVGEGGVLVDKISDLIKSLEPMKNISKALISLDFHMRRLLPLLEQCQNGRHSSTAGLLKDSN